jgi:hypothetical protein
MEINGGNGVRSIQEGQQWHLCNHGIEIGRPSPGGDEPGTIPRDVRVENGHGVVGRRDGGPASSYWDLLRAHLSDPLTWVPQHDCCFLENLVICSRYNITCPFLILDPQCSVATEYYSLRSFLFVAV